jgi:hypothetical protein
VIKKFYLQCSEFPKFYRFEGTNSYNHFDFSNRKFLRGANSYAYFSKSFKHHRFYTAKRLRQLINQGLLNGTKLSLKKTVITRPEQFSEILRIIKTTPLDEPQVSIEFTVSPLFTKLMKNNAVRHTEKKEGEAYIEKVDLKQSGGGYGFCDEWLELFDFFTYFYAHQRITRTDLVNFLYAYRSNVVHHFFQNSPVPFLAYPERRIVEVSQHIASSFDKYELMDILERILLKKLYFPNSFLAEQQESGIKQVVAEYLMEKEAMADIQEYSKKF